MERGSVGLGGLFASPGKAVKGLLYTIGGLSIVNAILFNWVPGGQAVFHALVCTTDAVVERFQVWRLLTAGFLTLPTGQGAFTDLLFALAGFFFFGPDLERRWGGARLVRFVLLSLVAGFLLALAFDRLTPAETAIFHPRTMFGSGAAFTAITVAWALANAESEVRLFFVLPVRGRHMLWFSVAYCVMGLLYWEGRPEGVVAPFGGLLVGLLFGGSPSAVRSLYLRAKLAVLRRRVDSLDSPPSSGRVPRPAASSRRGGPPLRVVYGGLEEDLKKRKPGKDKRYLN